VSHARRLALATLATLAAAAAMIAAAVGWNGHDPGFAAAPAPAPGAVASAAPPPSTTAPMTVEDGDESGESD